MCRGRASKANQYFMRELFIAEGIHNFSLQILRGFALDIPNWLSTVAHKLSCVENGEKRCERYN